MDRIRRVWAILSKQPLSKVKRGPNRAQYDKETAFNIMDASLMCSCWSKKKTDKSVSRQPCHWRDGEPTSTGHAHSKRVTSKANRRNPEKGASIFPNWHGLVNGALSDAPSVNYRSVTFILYSRLIWIDKEEKVRQFKTIF